MKFSGDRVLTSAGATHLSPPSVSHLQPLIPLCVSRHCAATSAQDHDRYPYRGAAATQLETHP